MRIRTTLAAFTLLALLIGIPASAATPKEAVGFMGTVTGSVKSAEKDGSSFVLVVSNAEPNEQSAVKNAALMVGKEITLGVRMPRKDGKPTQHPDDVAWIKTMKPGRQVVKVTVFAVRADPTVLRITAPGQDVTPQK